MRCSKDCELALGKLELGCFGTFEPMGTLEHSKSIFFPKHSFVAREDDNIQVDTDYEA